MNSDKQIDGIDCNKCIHFEACKIAFRNSKDLGIYDCTEEEYFNSTLDCDYYIDNKTYRKASDIAREIFEEIELEIRSSVEVIITIKDEEEDGWYDGELNMLGMLGRYIAELKKKYESEKDK